MLVWVSFIGGDAPEVEFNPNAHQGTLAVRLDIEPPHARVYREGGHIQVPWVGNTARFHVTPGSWLIKGGDREHFEIKVIRLSESFKLQVKFIYWQVVATCIEPVFNPVSPNAKKVQFVA